jgi:hypothetical protein
MHSHRDRRAAVGWCWTFRQFAAVRDAVGLAFPQLRRPRQLGRRSLADS